MSKRRKTRKLKRAYLKSSSMRSFAQLNPLVKAEYNARARGLQGNGDIIEGWRNVNLHLQIKQILKFYSIDEAQINFPSLFPQSSGSREADPRLLVEIRLKQLAEASPIERNVCLINTRRRKVVLYYTDNYTSWYFTECDQIMERWRVSRMYSSREGAMEIFRCNEIKWNTTYSFAELTMPA